MKLELTSEQKLDREQFKQFSDQEIVPHADHYDAQQALPSEIITKLAQAGYLALAIPVEYGGVGKDMLTLGLLHEQIGRGCSSVRSLLTVHGMVESVIARWGDRRQKEYWLPRLSSGQILAAFGLTEPEAGSDAGNIRTEAKAAGDFYFLSGRKKWISFGQIANLFLIFARCEGKPIALLVERETPGLEITPLQDLYGTRASMLAELKLEECRVPRENLIGKPGFGLSHIASSALDEGRYTVAWGCVGILRACLDASLRYATTRKQYGKPIKEFSLIGHMLSDMVTDLRAATLLCSQAGYYKDTGHPDAVASTIIAKYFASVCATKSASNAVQIHGANGCSSQYPVQRFLRDSRVMEIIEGSTQIHQSSIYEQYRPEC